MTDYKSYRDYVGVSNPQMISTLRKSFPSFSKVDASLINHPIKHGVCLLPEAEDILVGVYGKGPGLQNHEFHGEPKRKKPDKRKKGFRVAVRMTDKLFKQTLEMKEASGYTTMQDFLEALLMEAVSKWKGEQQ